MIALLSSAWGCGNEAVGNHGIAKASGPDVLAMVGEDPVSKADLELALQRLPERKRAALRGEVLDNIIEARVFAQEARSAGLDEDPAVKEALERAMKEILARSFVKKRIDVEAEPSGEQIETYYREHQDLFVVPDAVLLERTVF